MPRKPPNSVWTLVRHTAFSVAGKPAFKNAVEVESIDGNQAAKVIKAGGLIFNSYIDAVEREEKENYPDDAALSVNLAGVAGWLIPQARGTFVHRAGVGDIYIPGAKP